MSETWKRRKGNEDRMGANVSMNERISEGMARRIEENIDGKDLEPSSERKGKRRC
jgi:hypothetical protein